MQVECGATNLVGTTSSINFTWPTTFGRKYHSPTCNILYAFLHGLHPNGTFSRDTCVGVPKFWTFTSSSNQTCFEHAREIFYSPWKDLSNNVLHNLIENHLTLILRGFVIGSQISNLTLNPSFDHNSCISSLNGQCEGTLTFTFQDISNDILGVF
jgi:hypothetical protein